MIDKEDLMSKLEAVIICVNYSDFLKITLPLNLKHFDNVIVVTKESDTKTIEFCRSIDDKKLVLIKTDAFDYPKNKAKFNKGLAIDVGLQFLEHKSWVMNLDSDIVLPDNFREEFLDNNPNTECFYGFRRFDLPTQEDWDNYKETKDLSKYILYRGSGYGYAAIFNYNSQIFKKFKKQNFGFGYPVWFKDSADSDWVFRNHWGERVFNPPLGKFPECHLEFNNDYDTGLYKESPIRVIHLGLVGQNHSERITPKFND